MIAETVNPLRADLVANWDAVADVVVVGGGCAGVCAALSARETGASVILIERSGGLGGASAMSGGLLYLGGGTAVQRACGFQDDPEEMQRFLYAALGPEPDTERIAAYADHSVSHFDWLVANGVDFKPSMWSEPAWTPPTDDGLMWLGENSHPFDAVARPAPRGHRPAGSGRVGGILMNALNGALRRSGATMHGDTRVERLVTTADGDVVGVVGVQAGETVHVRSRGGVVLAAGGFVFNDQMLVRHAPLLLPHTKLGTNYDDGRGIQMAQAIGARVNRMDAGEASINFAPALMARGIIVNSDGQRFINEDTYGGRIGQVALYHHRARAYLIFDEEAFDSVPEELRHGRHPQWVCGTVAELEAELELPELTLQSTVSVYNEHARSGRDPVHHKDARWVRPIATPIAAMDVRARRADGPADPADRGTGFRVFTLGGLETTVDGHVRHERGEVIPGLYAAGRCTSGLPASGYISGTSLGDGTFFGRRAGTAAARRAAVNPS